MRIAKYQVEPTISLALSSGAPAKNLMNAVVRNPVRKVSINKVMLKNKSQIPMSSKENTLLKIIEIAIPITDITPLPKRDNTYLLFNDLRSILSFIGGYLIPLSNSYA